MNTITERRGRWKPARLLLRLENRRVELEGQCAEVCERIARRGSVTAADFAPGTRIASAVHKLRHRYAVPIIADRETTARGDATFARYRLAVPGAVIAFTPGGRQR